jgi:hypothetical protein
MMIELTPIVNKFAINSQLRTLKNYVQMLILCPSYFITAVTQAMLFVRIFTHFISRYLYFFSYEIVKELESQDLNM